MENKNSMYPQVDNDVPSPTKAPLLRRWKILSLFLLSIFGAGSTFFVLSRIVPEKQPAIIPPESPPSLTSQHPSEEPLQTPTPPNLPPTQPTPKECTKEHGGTATGLPIHYYEWPNISLSHVRVFGVLYLPDNIDLDKAPQYQQYDWPSEMCRALSRAADFWVREFEGRAKFTVEIIKDHLRGPALVEDDGDPNTGEGTENLAIGVQVAEAFLDNPDDSYPIKRVGASKGDYGTQYRVLDDAYVATAVFVVSDRECKPTCYFRNSAPWPDMAVMNDISFLGGADSHQGPMTLAHELGHILSIPHPFDDPDLSKGNKNYGNEQGNIMGYGLYARSLEASYLMPEQKKKMGL